MASSISLAFDIDFKIIIDGTERANEQNRHADITE